MKKIFLIQKTQLKRHKYLVIDEWLPHYLSDINNEDKQIRALNFIYKLIDYKCKILILKDGKFIKKANSLKIISDEKVRHCSKLLHNSILRNSKKTIEVCENKLSRVSTIIKNNKKIKQDDHYLIQLYNSRNNSCIITTDEILKNELVRLHFDIYLVDEFMTKFFK